MSAYISSAPVAERSLTQPSPSPLYSPVESEPSIEASFQSGYGLAELNSGQESGRWWLILRVMGVFPVVWTHLSTRLLHRFE